MDYNFYGLAPRSFEHLVQALALKYLSPRTVIFGDGPDGGREATVGGHSLYPDKTGSTWNGYIVVQAKFRQRQAADEQSWVTEQLKGELEKFLDEKRGLKRPEYYLLVTNVTLSAVADVGGKDKVFVLFEKYAKELGLRDYDIWDYDKLRAFLDSSPEIATRYAGWISTGDVLAQVISSLQKISPDFETAISNHLQKAFLADQYSRLEQAGRAGEERIPLANLFVDLGVTVSDRESSQKPVDFVRTLITSAKSKFDPESQQQATINSSRIPPPRGKYVLVGGPGQGKTTLTQFACQLFRASILKSRPSRYLIAEVKSALDNLEKQCTAENLTIPDIRRFPIQVFLSKFAAALANGTCTSLFSYVIAQLSQGANRSIDLNDLWVWLRSYPWVIFLDGLDEVPAPSNRLEVITAIKNFFVDCSQTLADVVIVMTTRPQGYTNEFSPEFYRHLKLEPLDAARGLKYAGRLLENRYDSDLSRRQDVLRRLSAASQDPTTERLLLTPLQVTIMATLLGRLGPAPTEPWSLFHEYYKTIYDRELDKETSVSGLLRDVRKQIDVIHGRVGLLLQIRAEHSGGTNAFLKPDELSAMVALHLEEEGFSESRRSELIISIVHAATIRLVFLVGLEAEQIGFELRPVQEFMAAEGLTFGQDDEIRERLRAIIAIPFWRNVFILAASKCSLHRDYLSESIHSTCHLLNDPPNDTLARASLAGSHVALDMLEAGCYRSQPRFLGSLTRLSFRLLELGVFDLARRIATIYAKDTDQVFQEELSRRLQASGAERIASLECLVALHNAGITWAMPEYVNQLESTSLQAEELTRAISVATTEPLVRPVLFAALPKVRVDSVRHLSPIAGLQGQFKETAPRWFQALDLVQGSEVFYEEMLVNPRIVLPSGEKSGVGVSVIIISEYFGILDAIPSGDPSWIPVRAAGSFCLNPSNLSLAKSLRITAEAPNLQTKDWQWFRCPWPLKICLEQCQTAEQLRRFASRAENGEFGSLDTWKEAETRWRKSGIIFEDIRYSATNPQLDKQIDQIGFPFAAITSISYGDRPRAFTKMLTELFPPLTSSFARGLVADLILADSWYNGNLKIPDALLPELLLAQNEMGWGVDLDGLAATFELHDLNDEWVPILDALGRTATFYDTSGGVSTINTGWLISAVKSNPNRLGLLRLLAEFDGSAHIKAVPSLNELRQANAPPNVLIAGLNFLIRLDPSHNDMLSITSTLAELANRGANVNIAVNAMLNLSEEVAGAPLARLFAEIEPMRMEMRALILNAIQAVLKKRVCPIGTPEGWIRCKLPSNWIQFLT